MNAVLKKMFDLYKIQFLASATVCVVLIALKTTLPPLGFTLIILGSLVGTFLLDLDYIIYAFFIEPEKDFSTTVRAFIKHKDLFNAITYIHLHREEVKDKTLNGAMFQMILAGAALFVMSSPASLFVKALIVSTFVNSIYRMWENYFDDKIDDWFWGLKFKVNKNSLIWYTVGLGVALVFSLWLFNF